MNNNSKIQIFVVSQQSLFQQGIDHTFADTEDMVISGISGVSDEVLSALDNLPPDVALLDLDGPSESGLELARKIKQRSPNIGVIVLTSSPDDSQLFQALKAQAVAYLSKEDTADKLVETVRRVAKGEHVAGYKVGCTSRAIRQQFGLSEPICSSAMANTFGPDNW